ncbi:class I SAM-dependent methyltransferase [Schinkia azotoformans]|uniref:class I SAM-dependent methyltransferase n=1 Tax=Schinkia azotoformans TaxID=1454 RepID=UPI002E205A67|nr:class I SAM-dependent methyltransferase [Schinkia azotoformans]
MDYTVGNVNIAKVINNRSEIYSDGDIELEILKRVQQEGFNESEFVNNDDRWDVLYHFSKNRWNLLDWYPFNTQSNLLEIGAGCGALSGLFCEKVRRVHALEMSERRAKILAYRHKNRKNLDVIIANLHDFNYQEKYDYVTLIGVLEYAGKFSDDLNNPYKSLLVKTSKLLKSNGTLLVAIENKFGLRYWAGCKEDHTGNLFEGIEGYRFNRGIKTFSIKEIKNLLIDAGFNQIKMYYPYPDYKLPEVIYSDNYLPSIGELYNYLNYERDRYVFFNEKNVLNEIIRDNEFPMFSNSFLIEASL